ncbi:SRPBCC family protein [Halobacteriales archaeon QS_9_67_17]|nr:MAG: SRPBCC family protein [Halobacteriales archaeon QS_9_67_17]
MVAVSESIEIDAPVDAVFDYMDDPHNQAEISPSIADIRDVEQDETGKSLAFTYEMAGVSLDGRLETETYDPETEIVFDMQGALSGTITWEFEPTDGGTRVTYAAEYDFPSDVLEAVVHPFAERYNERELRTTLENLKTRMEAAE